MKNIYKSETIIKIKFKNKSLITRALTHKSADQKNNNEKLEFLGDRVIGLVLSKKLFDLYPNENEGDLDKRFAILVRRKTCSEIAWSLNLQKNIITGNQKKKINRNDEKILSDCCEALIGAIYLDQGFDFVENFILKTWKKYLDKSDITILDPKTKLQEYSLKNFKILPIYKVISNTGPRHKPKIKVAVKIKNSKFILATGSSKKNAEQIAAKELLKIINQK